MSISIEEDDRVGFLTSCGTSSSINSLLSSSSLSSCQLMENHPDTSNIKYSVTLTSEPKEDVTVSLIGDSLIQSNDVPLTNFNSLTSVTFTPVNWYTPQYIDLSFIQNYFSHYVFLFLFVMKVI